MLKIHYFFCSNEKVKRIRVKFVLICEGEKTLIGISMTQGKPCDIFFKKKKHTHTIKFFHGPGNMLKVFYMIALLHVLSNCMQLCYQWVMIFIFAWHAMHSTRGFLNRTWKKNITIFLCINNHLVFSSNRYPYTRAFWPTNNLIWRNACKRTECVLNLRK